MVDQHALNLPLVLCVFDFNGNYSLDAGSVAEGERQDLVCIFGAWVI